MKLRRLSVKNFRGIKSLDWDVRADFICLVGPGDSTKTTIMDAIGLVLSSRYNVSFTDADFYACDTASKIEIIAAVVDLPDKLVEERSHGKNRSGIRSDGSFCHDPVSDGETEECLVVRLVVDQTLEPVWEVIRPGEEDQPGDRITANERSELGFSRLGEYADAHLRWSRGSALSTLTASRTDAAFAVIEAQRSARNAVEELTETPLHEAAEMVKVSAQRLGAGDFTDLRPGLDPAIASSAASLVLHDGKVPLTSFGLGSRRLTSLSIQENSIDGRAIVAIDELEHGLDPHRLLHLVRYLRERVSQAQLQVILTTHSPLVVEALSLTEIQIVSSKSGATVVTPVPEDLTVTDSDVTQGMIRATPSAFLARRIIVAEGATETGLLRYALDAWDRERKRPATLTAVTAGVTVVNGNGDAQAPQRARALAQLGYPVFLVLDGDVTTNAAHVADAVAAGVEVRQWSTGNALEDVVVQSLNTENLQKMIYLAAEEMSLEGVLAALANQLQVKKLNSELLTDWYQTFDEATVRSAVARAAKGASVKGDKKTESKAWFKREDRGEQLARFLFTVRDTLSGTELAAGLTAVKAFCLPGPDMASER